MLTQVMQELKSADLCIPGSDRYSDFRTRFVSDEEFESSVSSYGQRAGVPTDPNAFVTTLRSRLAQSASRADNGFPENEYLRIENARLF